ncbi:ABC transporter substrate-binding protein [Streptomyces sp. NPDC059371]|uniref:ABC transporter substrate-binding protein n=1 Tax=Streptomyces sp. NPDC059371 TaxID=3346812 RepID=UPI0036BA6DD1
MSRGGGLIAMPAAPGRIAVCAGLVLALLLAGCGSGRGPTVVRLVVWMYPVITDPRADTAYWNQIEKDFAKATPGVEVTVRHLPWAGRDRRIADALAGGDGPDAVLLMPDQIPRFASQHALVPVDKALKGTVHTFLPAALDAVTHDGRIYGAPIYQTVTTTIYNKRLLAEAGVTTPPSTWDEIKAAAPRLRGKGIALLDYSASDDASLNLNFYPLLWQAGGRVFAENGTRVAFNSPAGVEALTFLTGLYRQGAVPATAMDNANRFDGHALGRQRAAMGYSVVLTDADLAARAWGKENVLVGGPLKGPVREAAFGAPGSLAVSARSRHGAQTEQFLAFMTRPEQIRSLGRASGYLSPRADVVVPSNSPYAMQYQAALASVFAGEPHPASRRVMELLAPEIRAALTGRKSPAAALDAAAAAADELLRSP